MPELIEHVRALLAAENRNEVVKLLHTEAQPIYQAIFDKGHGAGLKKGEEKETELTAKVTAAEATAADYKTKLEAAEKDKPDLAKIRADHDAQLQQEREKHRAAIAAKDAKHLEDKRRGDKARLQAKLVSAGVDPLYAKVAVDDPDIVKRLSYRKDDGELEVLQAGSSVPFAPADGKEALDLLVEEMRPKVDPKWITSGGDNGSNERNGGTGGTATDANFFANIRKQAEEQRKGPAPLGNDKQAPSALDRMRGAPART